MNQGKGLCLCVQTFQGQLEEKIYHMWVHVHVSVSSMYIVSKQLYLNEKVQL